MMKRWSTIQTKKKMVAVSKINKLPIFRLYFSSTFFSVHILKKFLTDFKMFWSVPFSFDLDAAVLQTEKLGASLCLFARNIFWKLLILSVFNSVTFYPFLLSMVEQLIEYINTFFCQLFSGKYFSMLAKMRHGSNFHIFKPARFNIDSKRITEK